MFVLDSPRTNWAGKTSLGRDPSRWAGTGSMQLRSRSDITSTSAVLRMLPAALLLLATCRWESTVVPPASIPSSAQEPTAPAAPSPCQRVPPGHRAPHTWVKDRTGSTTCLQTPLHHQEFSAECAAAIQTVPLTPLMKLLKKTFILLACSSSFTPTRTLLWRVKNTPTQGKSCGNTFPYSAAYREPTQQGGYAFTSTGTNRSLSSAGQAQRVPRQQVLRRAAAEAPLRTGTSTHGEILTWGGGDGEGGGQPQNHRITESQNRRGWKGPLWVI